MTILKMSLLASILIVAVVLIRIFAVNKLPKKTLMVLWAFVLCRLLIPISVPSFSDSQNLIGRVFSFITESELVKTLMYSSADKAKVNLPTQSEKIIQEGFLSSVPPYIVIWIVGMVILASYFLLTHLRYLREYKTALPVNHPFIDQWLSKQKRKIKIRQSDKILSPLTYGVWRPVILLPKTMNYSDTNQLEYVLTHELIHIKRFDMLTKWLLVVALCVHWFNPLVWVMYVFANRDIELSCDESVVRTFGEDKKTSYALALISMAESRRQSIPLYSNFSKDSIEERIVAIMKMNKSNLLGGLLIIVFLTGSIFTTNVSFAKEESDAIGLFDHVDTPEDIYQYTDNVNEVYSETVILISEEQRMYIQNVIFTDHHVYAIIGLEGDVQGQPIIDGRIVTDDEQIVYGLDSQSKEIEQAGDNRYFLYTGEIAKTVTIKSEDIVQSGGQHFLESNRLRDHEDTRLDLEVNLNETEYHLRTNVENVSEDMLIFQPDARNYESDFYDTIILTSNGFNMTGSSNKSAKEWEKPHLKMTIVRTDGTDINLSYDTRGSISDEGFPGGLTQGFNPDTGGFSGYWKFRQWELDLAEVETLIIDGVSYQVN